MKVTKTSKNSILIIALVAILLILVLFIISCLLIEQGVKEASQKALAEHSGPRTEALIEFVKNREECDKEKSHALWALGQLGDKDALDFLNENYAEKTEDNSCVYEARFAIEKINRDQFNLPAFLWRWTWE